MIRLALCLLTALAAASPALAQDSDGSAEPAQRRRIDGVQCRVELHSGRRLSGVVTRKSIWERPVRSQAGYGWEEVDRDHPDAGVRLWYVALQDGYVFVKQADVAKLESLGELSLDASNAIADATEQSRLEAKAERLRLQQERAERIAAERAAAEAEEAATEAEAEAEATADAEGGTEEAAATEPADQVAKYTALLVRFPPSRWSLDTPQKVEHRRVILGLAPSTEEKEFLEVFEEWKRAYAVWQKAQQENPPTEGDATGS